MILLVMVYNLSYMLLDSVCSILLRNFAPVLIRDISMQLSLPVMSVWFWYQIVQFTRTAITILQTGLQQKFFVLQLWEPEVLDQGINRVGSSKGHEEMIHSRPLSLVCQMAVFCVCFILSVSRFPLLRWVSVIMEYDPL